MLNILLCLLAFLRLSAAVDYCNVKCSQTPARSHTMCKYPGCIEANGCKRRALDTDEIRKIVDVHNRLRSLVADGEAHNQKSAGDMLLVSWSDELATIAQCWANQCPRPPKAHDVCRNTERNGVGQNWAMMSPIKERTVEHLIQLWFDEVLQLPDSIDDNPFKHKGLVVGHYTQLIWAKTTRIGCGTAVSDSSLILVCNYEPAGNFNGLRIYKAGKPCSECPDGYGCDDNYGSLCSRKENVSGATDAPCPECKCSDAPNLLTNRNTFLLYLLCLLISTVSLF